jgi:hypothetical protein
MYLFKDYLIEFYLDSRVIRPIIRPRLSFGYFTKYCDIRENKGEWFGMMYLLGAIRRL